MHSSSQSTKSGRRMKAAFPPRLRPHLETLEHRCVPAQALFGGQVLKETFDDPANLDWGPVSASGGTIDDHGSLLSDLGPPVVYQDVGVVFHHNFNFEVFLDEGGTTPPLELPGQSAQDLLIVGRDTIAIQPYVPSGFVAGDVAIAALDLRRNDTPVTVTFVGDYYSETFLLPASTFTGPPSVIGGSAATSGSGSGSNPIGVIEAPELALWDTVAASSEDVVPSGGALGPIRQIIVNSSVAKIDNVRALVFFDTGVNQPPIAADGFVLVDAREGASLPFLFGEGSRDPDGDAIHFTGHSDPAHGTLADLGNGYFIYYPEAGFTGEDHFDFTIADTHGVTDTATVTLLVDHRPNGVPDAYTIAHGTTGVVEEAAANGLLANDRDVDGDHLTASVSVQPVHGTVAVFADGSFRYVPNTPNQLIVTDAFTYTLTDGHFTDEYQVSLRVPNAAPTASRGAIAAPHNAPTPLHGTFSANDPDGDPLQAILVEDGQYGHAALSVVNGRVEVEYTSPYGRAIGSDRVTYQLFDGYDYSEPATIDVVVPNNPPYAIADHVEVEDFPGLTDRVQWSVSTFNAFLFGFPFAPLPVGSYNPDFSPGLLPVRDFDPDGDPLTYSIVEGPKLGLLDFRGDTGEFTYYLPDPAVFPVRDVETGTVLENVPWLDHGYDWFTYEVSDGHDASRATVVLSVPSVDPQIHVIASAVQVYDVEAGTFADVTQGIFGPIINGPRHGRLELVQDRGLVYYPEPGFVGVDSLWYLNSVGYPFQPEQFPEQINFLVRNTVPEPANDYFSTERDQDLVVQAVDGLLANDTDHNGQPLRVAFIGSPAHGEIVAWGEDGSFTYRPDPGFFGIDTFDYVATDGYDTAAPTVTITVLANRRPHLASDLDFNPVHNLRVPLVPDPLVGELAWSDRDGDTVNPLIVAQHGPRHGRAELRIVGDHLHIEYYPDHGQFAPYDEFLVAVSDGQAQSDAALIRVIRDSNTSPVAHDDFFMIQNRPVGDADTLPVVFSFPGVTWNDADINGDVLSTTLVTGPAHGRLTLENDGRFIYWPERGFAGDVTFVYSVDDGSGVTTQATVTLRVVAEQVPAANDDENTFYYSPAQTAIEVTRGDRLAAPLPLGGANLTDNDTVPPDWADPFHPDDWTPVLIARPRQLRGLVNGGPDLLLPEGMVFLFPGYTESSNPASFVSFQSGLPQADGTFLVPFVTGEVDLTYAWKNLHSEFLSNVAQVRLVVAPPTQGSHATVQVPVSRVFEPYRVIDLQSSPGTLLEKPEAVQPPAAPPPGYTFLHGKVLQMSIGGMGPGGAATVTLTFGQALPANLAYMKYGRRDDNPLTPADESLPQWYEWPHDPITGTGAEVIGNQIILHFVDGQRGDDDLLANGVIVDPGGPALRVTAPQVQSVIINDGAPQRSKVNSITVSFSDQVTLAAGAFQLKSARGSNIPLKVATKLIDGKSVAVLTFRGAGIIGGSLADGFYQLIIHAAKIRNAAGVRLDGDRDGLPGGDAITAFFRKFGDADGDGDVDAADAKLFAGARGRRRGKPSYLWYFDFDGDGVIGKTDAVHFRSSSRDRTVGTARRHGGAWRDH